MKLKFTHLIAASACALLFSVSANAQVSSEPTFSLADTKPEKVKYDSTYRPATWQVQVDYFKSHPNSKKDIVFLGNSLTAHMDWAELLGNKNVRNRGISSDITFGVLERLDEVIEGKPAKVFLLIGINDISRNVPEDVILANYSKIVRRIKAGSPKTKIYVQTLLPTNNSFDKFKKHYNKEKETATVNQGIKEIAAREKITVIDLNPHFADSQGQLITAYTHDGLHLTIEGYKKWAEILKKHL
ncbi:GDSL-type esterase/lipase family protein [Pontibacter burrus]|uniref:Sialate O-acetylesterase n=1 Tax=Pontibacter burrus TaxID=2704466 RepID=A0A6B3M1A8_9BACT|nr:GDSL-type esterase/lipase family protein [Pontibacter burrus]NEM99371.1 sialate O-acetylesterase [Pontibacter burrus]